MDTFIQQAQDTTAHLKEALQAIRTGRASPSVVENIIVETYGGQTKLKLRELSTIMNEDPTTLSVSPFDPSTIQDIERAIHKSPLGLSPQLQGTKLFIRLPPLSQEQRDKMLKLIGQIIEEHKVSIRNQRDDARKHIRMQFEKKEITEDMKFRAEKDLDTQAQNCIAEIDTIRQHKEKEIQSI